jgi:hypothetical protein
MLCLRNICIKTLHKGDDDDDDDDDDDSDYNNNIKFQYGAQINVTKCLEKDKLKE